MDPEVRKALDEIHALTRENHRLLKAIRRDWWFSFFARVIIWAFVLLLPLYLYQHYVEPVVTKFIPNASSTPSSFLNIPSASDIQKAINSYTGGAK